MPGYLQNPAQSTQPMDFRLKERHLSNGRTCLRMTWLSLQEVSLTSMKLFCCVAGRSCALKNAIYSYIFKTNIQFIKDTHLKA